MFKRTLIGITLFAGFSAMAEGNLQLERCSANRLGLESTLTKWQSVAQEDVTSREERILLRKQILAPKLNCLYQVLSEQVGGENTVIFEAVKSGKFKAGMETMKNARLDLLREVQLDKIQNVCGKPIKDLFGNKCVMEHADFAVLDMLATADAIQELTLPTMLPVPTANLTLDQQRAGHVSIVKMPPFKK